MLIPQAASYQRVTDLRTCQMQRALLIDGFAAHDQRAVQASDDPDGDELQDTAATTATGRRRSTSSGSTGRPRRKIRRRYAMYTSDYSGPAIASASRHVGILVADRSVSCDAGINAHQ